MKKIYILTSNISKIGGVQRVSVNLANEFAKKYDVTIINAEIKKQSTYFELNPKIDVVYLNVKFENEVSKLELTKNLFMILFRLKKFLKSKVNKNEENVIIAMGIRYSYILSLLNLKDVKKIGSQHGGYKNNKILNLIRSKLFKKLDFFITLNPDMYEESIKQLKLLNIKMIPNFISDKEYLEEKKLKKLKYSLAIGRFCKDKGFDYLIEIWDKIVKSSPDSKLKIIGDGELKNELIEMIKIKKLEKNIEILPATSDIKKYYAEADLYLLTSRREGFGMVLLEAMASGVPIISFNCPTGPKALIQNGYNGYLVECYNIEKFVEFFLFLSKNKIKYNELSRNALEFARNYSSQNIIKKWEEII